MVGYSSLSQRDEPLALEYARELQARLRPQVEAHRGRVVKTLGDGVLAEFESALEATRCAVEVQKELYESNTSRGGPKLEARVGVHIGDVVHEGYDVLGDTVNIAARIEPLAEPGGVAISGHVFEQVTSKIPYTATQLEHAFLKNIDTPIAVYSLDLPWHAAPAARITPFTDRITELEGLRDAVARAAQSHGAIVAIVGESGVGKTRLSDEAFRVATRRGFRVARARGFENVQTGPYALWAELARELLRDVPSLALYRAAEGCARELAGLVPELVERLGPLPPQPELAPDSARLQFFAGISRFLENVARQAPLALLLDDLQWADPETLALLQYLSQRIGEIPILVVLTYRDQELDADEPLLRALGDLRMKRVIAEITLRRLGPADTLSFVGAALGGGHVAPELPAAIAEKTGGNPLFVEEVLRSLTEEEALVRTPTGWAIRPGSAVTIPSSVRETVLRRIRRLGPELQGALEAASVLGNEFEFDHWAELCGIDENRLLSLAEAGLRARLLVERELAPGRVVYRLADEQVQAVLYGTLSLARRQRLHRRAGEILEARLGARADDRAAELGQHFLRGDRPEKAFDYFFRAGTRAREVFARDRAIDAYRQGAELVERAVASPPGDADWEVRGAKVYGAMGDEQYELAAFAEARASYLRGSALAGVRDPVRAALLLSYAGEARQRTNDYSGARGELQEAEAMLDRLPSDARGETWWTAWRGVQRALFMIMYWLRDTNGREQILDRLGQALERRGVSDELAGLYHLKALHGWRRDRTATDETFGFYQAAWQIWENERKQRGKTEPDRGGLFTLGFFQYWHGDFEESRATLRRTVEYAQKVRDVTTTSRAINYLLATERRRGNVEEVRRLVPDVREAAQRASLPEYEAFAVANDAWVHWRTGAIDQVDLLGQSALHSWANLPERYPVDWMALWPMIALSLSRGDTGRAIDLARGLLDPTQEPLPPALRDLVSEAIGAAASGNVTKAAETMSRAVETAQQTGFL
jgi:hypothetical protein